MTAQELFQAGRLQEAIDAAIADVKKHPADTGKRGFFCELLCFAGELERADKQLDLLSTQLPESAMQVALFRQLVRAEQARQDFYSAGRLPEFISEPTESQSLQLKASIEIREDNLPEAGQLIAAAEEARVTVSGTCDGVPFDDFRDMDDLLTAPIEVLTTTGKFYWIATAQIESLQFEAPVSPRDLLWRPARMSVTGGPDGIVYVPVIYAAGGIPEDEALKLGRATDWQGDESLAVLGAGQRTFLAGDQDRPILSMTSVDFGTSDA